MIKRSTNRIRTIWTVTEGTCFLSLKPSLSNFTCGWAATHFLISLALLGFTCINESGTERGFSFIQQRDGGNYPHIFGSFWKGSRGSVSSRYACINVSGGFINLTKRAALLEQMKRGRRAFRLDYLTRESPSRPAPGAIWLQEDDLSIYAQLHS